MTSSGCDSHGRSDVAATASFGTRTVSGGGPGDTGGGGTFADGNADGTAVGAFGVGTVGGFFLHAAVAAIATRRTRPRDRMRMSLLRSAIIERSAASWDTRCCRLR